MCRQMRPRPATRAASFVNLPPYLSAAEAAERRFWPDSAHEGCCALPVQAANVILRNHDSENHLFAEPSSHDLRSASSPTLLTEQVGRRRPQRPGNQHALARVFRCPPIIHPRELPATADSAAIVQQTRKFTFRWTHFVTERFGPQQKNMSPLCRNCGRRNFPVESLGKPRTNSLVQLRGSEDATALLFLVCC
jgi:hypothetical protein